MTTTRVRALRRYRRGLVASTAALALTSALAGCGSSKSGGSAATGSAAGPGSSCTEVDASTTEVKIADFKFEPACVSVAVGTKVTFINTDSTVHTATDPTDDVFDSGNLDKGQTFTQTFRTAGTYNYICDIHQYMKGTVVVR